MAKSFYFLVLLNLIFTVSEGQTTFYSYQSGNWSSGSTWTTDPSGTVWVNGSVPGTLDNIVILNGRTIKINENTKQINALTINYGGVVDLQATTGHNFGVVSGQGLLKSNSSSFPGGNFSAFVSASGGTIEFYNLSGALPMPTSPANTFNNLLITKDNPSGATLNCTLNNNLTVNGDLVLSNTQNTGTLALKIGNNTTSRAIDINGSLEVKEGCSFGVSSFNVVHTVTIFGDLINTGTVDLNNNAPNANNTQGAARITFKGATDNIVSINATTAFYDFWVDKGVDQTPLLEVYSSAPVTPFEGYNSPKYSVNLVSGTLKLGTNINVPIVVSGGNFDISSNRDNKAGLWVSSNATIAFQHPVVVYGKLRISDNASMDGGPVIVTRQSGEIEIEGGSLIVRQFRPSTVTGENPRGSFTMKSGTMTVTGPQHAGGYAIFDWQYPNTSFKMSGGTININDANATGSLQINSLNYEVTGGTININIPTTNNAVIQSAVPLWNLNILKNAATTNSAVITNLPLQVLNNLTIQTGNNPVLDAGGNNLLVGGNFNLQTGTTYTPGTNTTVFNGAGGQTFDNAGTITSGLNNLTVSNAGNLTVNNDLVLRNNLTIDQGCFINDNGKRIAITGNIYNSGTAISKADGGIEVNGTVNQVIGGNGSGIFGNFYVNKSSGSVSLAANQAVTGNIRLANGIPDLQTYNLRLSETSHIYDALTGTGTSFSAAKMIRTSGNQSDGGLSKAYNATGSFVFPVGTNADYSPATIQFNAAPASWGTVTVKPVSRYNPVVTSGNSLNYYWKVTSIGFTGIPAGSVSHAYRYTDASIAGRGTESAYIPGAYRPYSWTIINDISKVVDNTNDILFNNINYIDGEYTAGEPDAFQPVKIFYSRQTGPWNDYQTWSTDSVGGNPVPDPAPGPNVAGINIPGPNNPVVIGNGTTKNHIVTIPPAFSNVITGSLIINLGSALDLTTTTGHNFGYIPESKVTGNGKLRISSNVATATFPGGDFGKFLSAGGGTVEYYTSGTNFVLPAGASTPTYNNLIISPETGRTITLPSIDLTIFNNLETDGGGITQLNSASNRSLNVKNDLTIKQGTLRFMNNSRPQTITVEGNVTVNNGTAFDLTSLSNALNKLLIKGSLINNGTFDMYRSATSACDVTFYGDENKTIGGTATLTEFNYLTVDKGFSRNTLLDVTIDKLSLLGNGNALLLNNGTFRVSNPALSFTLSTNNSFTIPKTGCLSVSEGTVNTGTNSDNGDLLLVGRLEVINNGIVNVGNGGNFNNDIEYSPNGIPEIIVRNNATLNVTGQIRRGNTLTSGSLSYTQSGGNTLIRGRNQIDSRGKFEILNPGSQFNISGGTITIENGGGSGTWFGDVLLTPGSSSVLGGTFILGNASTTSNSFLVNVTCPLWNLTVDGTSTNKTANIRVSPVVIKNNLTINGNSEFRANGWDVAVGGNFTNNNNGNTTGLNTGGYQAGSNTQLTTFDGSSQVIAGAAGNVTNFANLVVAASGNVSMAANTTIEINKKLSLVSGILSDEGNTINITGDIDNAATHFSSAATGGVVLKGISGQVISGNGNGKFGNVTLNNPTGVAMIDDSEIDGILTFTQGSLYIDDYLLTLGVNATMAGTMDVSRQIRLNGALSDRGVKKYFPAGSASFSFPIGTAGKYTPVSYNITGAASDGFIKVLPVNAAHPNLQDAAGNELAYYWVVSSSGLANATVQHFYNYTPGDVSGTESSFVAGRYYQGNWTPAGGIAGGTDAANDQITLMNSSGVDFIDGEYTAGTGSNFTSIAVYYNRVSGNWEDPGTWSTDPVLKFAGPPAATPPNGNPVFIAPGNTVTINNNSQKAYSVDIPNTSTLNIKNTVFHNLGYLTGGGTLSLTSTNEGMFVMPGGNYDALMLSPTTTIIFHNPDVNNPATLPLKPGNIYKPLQNVVFTGNGTKYISAENLKVLGNLTIEDGVLSNALYNKNIYILGNWTDNVSNAAKTGFVPGTGWVNFEGSAPQLITATKNNSTLKYYNFLINNPQGVTLNGNGKADISNFLQLSNGVIHTNSANSLTLSNLSPSVVIGGSTASFVNGPLRKNIGNGSYFTFPVGKDGRYGNVYVNSVAPSGIMEAEFYNADPTAASMPVLNKVLPIDTVNNSKYWRINTPVNTQGNVRIYWDAADIASGFIPGSAMARNKLRVVKWNGTAWENQGNIVNDAGKSVQTSSLQNFSGDTFYGLAIESLPTAVITAGNASICNDGSSTAIQIDLTGTPPWSIRYKVNGGSETTVSNIASSPYTLVVSNSTIPLNSGPGTYTFTLSQVMDATGATGIKDFSKTFTVTLNESPNPVISGNATVPGGQTATYSTPNHAGHTYSWTVAGGTISSGQNTNQITVTWGAGPAGTVRVTETVTVGGCFKTTAPYNVNITDIPNPLVSGNYQVCSGATSETYSTPDVGTHTYLWTVTGGTIVSGQNTHSIAVDWTTPGNGSVRVDETGSETNSNTLNVTVNPVPSKTNTVVFPTICSGETANIEIQGAAAGITYQLRLDSDNSNVGTAVSSGPGGNVILQATPVTSTLYNIRASNEYNCAVQLDSKGTVTVKPVPSTGDIYRQPNN